MTRTQRVMRALPATVCELAALEDVSVKRINALLCHLRNGGNVRRTDRRGFRYGRRGRAPSIWERA